MVEGDESNNNRHLWSANEVNHKMCLLALLSPITNRSD